MISVFHGTPSFRIHFLFCQLFFKLKKYKKCSTLFEFKNSSKISSKRHTLTKLRQSLRTHARIAFARPPVTLLRAHPSRFCAFSFCQKNKISSKNTLTQKSCSSRTTAFALLKIFVVVKDKYG
jgi:hypothetical protein